MTVASSTPSSRRFRLNPAGLAARGAEIALVVLIAWIAAQALWVAIYGSDALALKITAPTRSTDIARVDGGGVSAVRGLFSTPQGAVAAAPSQAPQTRLNLTLRGVRSGADGTGGSAVIETPDRGQRSIAVDGEIAPGVTLAAVYEDRVIINRGGARESLYLTEAAARRARQARTQAPAVAEPPAASDQAPRALSLEDWTDGLRLEPALDAGVMTGLRVRGTSSNAVLSAAGLAPGDVITAVNGQALTSAEAGARALSGLEGAPQIVLTVRRANEVLTLSAPLQ